MIEQMRRKRAHSNLTYSLYFILLGFSLKEKTMRLWLSRLNSLENQRKKANSGWDWRGNKACCQCITCPAMVGLPKTRTQSE